MNAKSIDVYTLDSLENELRNLIQTDFRPTIGIAFSSPDFPFKEAISIFREFDIALVGCTSSGEIHDQKLIADSFSVLLLDMHKDYFQVVSFEHEDEEAFSSGTRLHDFACKAFPNPGIILLISGVRVVGDGPVKGLKENLKKEIPIYGGLAGDNIQHDASYVFTHQDFSDFGVSALIIDTDRFQMNGLAVSGWQPLGKTHLVTKADKNIIYEIDGQPALDLFLNYFGNIVYKPSKTEGIYSIPGQYPLKVEQEDGTSYMRSLLIYDTEDRALLAAGEVPTQSAFRFCPPPDFSVVTETVDAFKDFSLRHPDADALVMFSCKGRHVSFGPMLDDEVKSIYEIWNAPMVGFLSNGEIGNAAEDGICEFHNVSCSVVGIKEI